MRVPGDACDRPREGMDAPLCYFATIDSYVESGLFFLPKSFINRGLVKLRPIYTPFNKFPFIKPENFIPTSEK